MQTNDPRQKENQDEQANTADQGNQLLENPNNDEETLDNQEDEEEEDDDNNDDEAE